MKIFYPLIPYRKRAFYAWRKKSFFRWDNGISIQYGNPRPKDGGNAKRGAACRASKKDNKLMEKRDVLIYIVIIFFSVPFKL